MMSRISMVSQLAGERGHGRRPCAFCGWPRSLIKHQQHHGAYVWIQCALIECQARGPRVTTKAAAVCGWNAVRRRGLPRRLAKRERVPIPMKELLQ